MIATEKRRCDYGRREDIYLFVGSWVVNDFTGGRVQILRVARVGASPGISDEAEQLLRVSQWV